MTDRLCLLPCVCLPLCSSPVAGYDSKGYNRAGVYKFEETQAVTAQKP